MIIAAPQRSGRDVRERRHYRSVETMAETRMAMLRNLLSTSNVVVSELREMNRK